MDSQPEVPAESAVEAAETRNNPQTPLVPLHVSISVYQCAVPLSGLPLDIGIVCTLSYSDITDPLYFMAALIQETSTSLITEIWYRNWIEGRTINGKTQSRTPLQVGGFSHCEFSLPKCPGNVPTLVMPTLYAKGFAQIPFSINGRPFEHLCVIVPNMFYHKELEMDFGIILGDDFLKKNGGSFGQMLNFAPLPVLDELVIHTSAHCLPSNQAASQVRWGFGIYFPALAQGAEISSPAPPITNYTNWNVHLHAMVRAIELVQSRGIPCKSVRVLSDSSHAVQLAHRCIFQGAAAKYLDPVDFGSRGYKSLMTLKDEFENFRRAGKAVVFNDITTKENHVANRLAYQGALAFDQSNAGEVL